MFRSLLWRLSCVAACLSYVAPARAEIPVAKLKEWDLSLDGRVNTFFSYSFGQPQPLSVPTWQGIEDRGTDRIAMTRIRSGFISNVLGLTLRRPLNDSTTLTLRFATWVGISQARAKSNNPVDTPTLDAREVYLRVDGPWGGALAGRNMALFSRGAITLDYDIEHGFGLGHPCALRTVQGAACGHAGHGLFFPGYNAGVVYNTPELVGLQLSIGAYDPAVNSERTYERTPYPRFEGEATWHWQKYVRAFVGALWQRFGENSVAAQYADSSGINYGGGLELGPVQLGFTGYFGQGLGFYTPLENSPLFSDDAGVVRRSRGYVGMAALKLGNTKLAGGYGASMLDKTENEPAGPFPSQTIPKRQLGASVGLYETFAPLVLALEYFRGRYDWYLVTDANGGPPLDNSQVVNFINAGVTAFF